jgi:VanZ family protein
LSRVLILIILVIVYVSLYPWHFAPVHLTVNPLWILVHSWHPPPFRYYVRDFINNVALYAPLGFAAHFVFRKSRVPAFGLFGPVLLGLFLSTAMELTQLFEPVRDTSILDVMMNVAGSGAGVMMALWFDAHPLRKTMAVYRIRVADRGVLLLAFGWFAWLFFPFFPVISLYYPYDKLAVFERSPVVEAVPLVSTAAAWFAAGLLIPAAGIRMPRRWFALTLLAVPAQFVILGRQPVPSFLLGAIAGFVLFAICDRF